MSVCAASGSTSDMDFSSDANVTWWLLGDVVRDMLPGYFPWVGAMCGSVLVGLSGVLPLLVIPIDQTHDLKVGGSANFLKWLLSFAVGGLLGDVFLHSLPEIFANDAAKNGGVPSIFSGMLILSGLMMFVVVEKFFTVLKGEAQVELSPIKEKLNNNVTDSLHEKSDIVTSTNGNKHITGYLNLLANAIDNFTHGLSIGGAFLISYRLGCFTTFAILVHEIPHEVGDFAILLRSGFTRWDATKGQILTAGVGLMGSLAAVFFSGASNSIEARTSWILPFTSGSFLYIALVTVLPDLLKEEDPKESFKQLSGLLLGIGIIAFVGTVLD